MLTFLTKIGGCEGKLCNDRFREGLRNVFGGYKISTDYVQLKFFLQELRPVFTTSVDGIVFCLFINFFICSNVERNKKINKQRMIPPKFAAKTGL